MQTNTDKLIATKDNGIGWITFNNPARHNAVSLEMWQALTSTLEAYAIDPQVRVIILSMHAAEDYVLQALVTGTGHVAPAVRVVAVEHALTAPQSQHSKLRWSHLLIQLPHHSSQQSSCRAATRHHNSEPC